MNATPTSLALCRSKHICARCLVRCPTKRMFFLYPVTVSVSLQILHSGFQHLCKFISLLV
jgi:hypothetical protein